MLDALKNVSNRESKKNIPVELLFFNISFSLPDPRRVNCVQGKSSSLNPSQRLVKNCLGKLGIFENGVLYE